jgi:hypothetical protein
MESIKIELANACAYLLFPGMIENVVKPGVSFDVKDALELKEANKKLSNGKPYVVLVTSGEMSTVTKEARELIASEDYKQVTIAKALVISSLGHKIVGNFYLSINKPRIKTQLFSDREKAIEWLKNELKNFNSSAE